MCSGVYSRGTEKLATSQSLLGILILALSLASVAPGSPRLVHSTLSLVIGRPANFPLGTVAGSTNGFGAM